MDDLEDTSSTRAFDTIFGEKTYQEVNDMIAEPLRVLLDNIALGAFADRALDVDLIRDFHGEFLMGVMPEIAGIWRDKAVRVGNHYPPEKIHVDRMMREFFGDLEARLQWADSIEFQLEALAFAEAQILHIHPFADFNGRAARVFVTEAMRRIDFPVIDLSVDRDTPEHESFVLALREYDSHKVLTKLCNFWRDVRFGRLR